METKDFAKVCIFNIITKQTKENTCADWFKIMFLLNNNETMSLRFLLHDS